MYKNQNCLLYFVDHNDIIDRIFCNDPGNVLNIIITLLKYHIFTMVILNFKGRCNFGPW